ncbi:MAG: endolytic transglycosylase MltG [Psychrobium sp.]|nr:endolytic transglycosylase MltG [Psychrobium sp.]
MNSEKEPRRWQKRIAFFLLLLITMILGGLTISYQWYQTFISEPIANFPAQLFTVHDGDNATKVLRRLRDKGVIKDIRPYKLIFMEQPKLTGIKSGSYQLNSELTPISLFELLSSGKEAQFSITFVEGANFNDWLVTLRNHQHVQSDALAFDSKETQAAYGAKQVTKMDAAQQNVAALDSNIYPNSAIEGRLFPDTYNFTAQTPAAKIIRRAAKVLDQKLANAWKNRQANLPFKNAYQALILASIIEKETGIAGERKMIASVFINRLNKRMRLQTDPTVIYGVSENYHGDITRRHLRDKNPYNTYVIKRLPPTPIAMPSWPAIEAALNPASSNYFYFVATGDGGHRFSRTLKQHNLALKHYLAKMKNKK